MRSALFDGKRPDIYRQPLCLQFLQQRLADMIAIAQNQSGASLARVFDNYGARGGNITRGAIGCFFDYEYC